MTILGKTNRNTQLSEEPIFDHGVTGEAIHTESIKQDTKGHSLHLSLNAAFQL